MKDYKRRKEMWQRLQNGGWIKYDIINGKLVQLMRVGS